MIEIIHGDCLERLKELPDNSIDAIVTDPPYGLSFMGKRWDYDVPSVDIWKECLRVLKPGGHLLAFAGTRTQHRMACNIEDAGFDIRDMIAWVYGSGFPKSLDVSKAIDRAAGAEREVVGISSRHGGGAKVFENQGGTGFQTNGKPCITAPATDAARQWDGWGTALKPALEPITVARKPLAGTVADNVLQWDTGAINVDGCRVGTEAVFTHSRGSNGAFPKRPGETTAEESGRKQDQRDGLDHSERIGRWPANLIHDGSDEVERLFPQSNAGKTGRATIPSNPIKLQCSKSVNHIGHNDTGSAARFFYCAKASKRERGEGNTHPTVKPIDLMRYLCRLVTPPGGTVLDPFMGSGSTGKAAILEGFQFIGIEREAEYVEIAKARIEFAKSETHSINSAP